MKLFTPFETDDERSATHVWRHISKNAIAYVFETTNGRHTDDWVDVLHLKLMNVCVDARVFWRRWEHKRIEMSVRRRNKMGIPSQLCVKSHRLTTSTNKLHISHSTHLNSDGLKRAVNDSADIDGDDVIFIHFLVDNSGFLDDYRDYTISRNPFDFGLSALVRNCAKHAPLAKQNSRIKTTCRQTRKYANERRWTKETLSKLSENLSCLRFVSSAFLRLFRNSLNRKEVKLNLFHPKMACEREQEKAASANKIAKENLKC